MTSPKKLIIFQETGFPLFIYDLKRREEIDINDPDTFLATSSLSLKLVKKEIKKGSTHLGKRKGEFHFVSPLENGAFIDLVFPAGTSSTLEDTKKKASRLLRILTKKITKIHKKTGLSKRNLSLVSTTVYVHKVSSTLTSFLEKVGEKRK